MLICLTTCPTKVVRTSCSPSWNPDVSCQNMLIHGYLVPRTASRAHSTTGQTTVPMAIGLLKSQTRQDCHQAAHWQTGTPNELVSPENKKRPRLNIHPYKLHITRRCDHGGKIDLYRQPQECDVSTLYNPSLHNFMHLLSRRILPPYQQISLQQTSAGSQTTTMSEQSSFILVATLMAIGE